jgi:hypothetical protein
MGQGGGSEGLLSGSFENALTLDTIVAICYITQNYKCGDSWPES